MEMIFSFSDYSSTRTASFPELAGDGFEQSLIVLVLQFNSKLPYLHWNL